MQQSFDTLDWSVIIGYFILLLGIAFWVIKQENKNTEDCFLAGRSIGWFVVGASIFASNIGSEHVVGLAGAGAGGKIPMLIYELHAWLVLALGWVFLPFYLRSGVFTMPEFLERRFNSKARWFLTTFSLLAYIMTKVSVTIYAGGIVISSLFHIDFWFGALLTVVLTGAYTILGGMRAVVYTEAVQTILIVVGAGTLTYVGLNEAGGWSGVKANLPEGYLNMWRPNDNPVFLFLIPGIIALSLKNSGQLQYDTADQAFATLLMQKMPSGLRGLVGAGLLAALMSSLASVFNSCSTLFTVDVYQKLYPDAPQKKLLRVGRIATAIVVVLGILWIPIMQNISGTLYEYLQSVQSYIAPPITAVFLLGIFFKRINSQGAMATLIAGLGVAVIRLGLELGKNSLDPKGFLYAFGNMNFLTFAAWFFLFSIIVCVVASLLTPAPAPEQIKGLTFSTLSQEQKDTNRGSYSIGDIVVSLIVLGIVAYVMISFRG